MKKILLCLCLLVGYGMAKDKDNKANDIAACYEMANSLELNSGVAENRAYRNFLVSQGSLDKGLADYYNSQEQQRAKSLKQQFIMECINNAK